MFNGYEKYIEGCRLLKQQLEEVVKASGFTEKQICDFLKTVGYGVAELHEVFCDKWSLPGLQGLYKESYKKRIQEFINKQNVS